MAMEEDDFPEVSHDVRDEGKEDGDGIVGKGQGSSKEDELEINGTEEDLKDGVGHVAQVPQPRAQNSTEGWEMFLHLRTIKVLLVEYDDCTRHVVAALLRNCGYEVLGTSNGVQAWKILQDLTNHIDIVLTEVVMPCMSGIALLCKIMSHKTRKNIPVIMMSSHDSMALVCKCLSKGAADFLVKPIRKNELKNLWQHVWRRCQSSSGSGSESGIQTQKSINSKSCEKLENNSGSSEGEDNGRTRLHTDDGSDGGSGNQSSWTKQAVDVKSSRAMSRGQLAECAANTCAQVSRSNVETSGNKGVLLTVKRESQEQEEQLCTCEHDNVAEDKNLILCTPGYQELQLLADERQKTLAETQKGWADPGGNLLSNNHKAAITGKATDNSNELPESNLSVKRLSDGGKEFKDGQSALRHSEPSAFSRYKTSSNPPNGTTGSHSLLDSSSLEMLKKEYVFNMESKTTSTINSLHPLSAFRPVKNDYSLEAKAEAAAPNGSNHHHHHIHIIEPQVRSDSDDFSVKKLGDDQVGGNPESYILNGSVSGSNNGQNGINGRLKAGGTNVGSGIGNRLDQSKVAGREAAVHKFRQKRKERCFLKKVRYQNRKRLAEQRPRVGGQFVRKNVHDKIASSVSIFNLP